VELDLAKKLRAIRMKMMKRIYAIIAPSKTELKSIENENIILRKENIKLRKALRMAWDQVDKLQPPSIESKRRYE